MGRRIAFWREHRGLTQADFGRLMGQSRRWVQDLEGGLRQADPRMSVLSRAAEVLRIPLEQLLSDPTPARQELPLPVEVEALADALHHLPAELPERPVQLLTVRSRLEFCYQAWAACHYLALARELPGLLADGHGVAVKSAEGAVLLSRAYQLAASLLYKYSSSSCAPGVVAAERALVTAERSGDVVAIGSSARRVARGLMHQHRYSGAAEYATATARRLRTPLERAGRPGLSALGMLHLVAAIAVTGEGRSSRTVSAAADRLTEAGEVAERQGGVGADFTGFGITNVRLHEVDVLLRLNDPWEAVVHGEMISSDDLSRLPRERHARHLVTTARALVQTRRRDQATAALVEAERLAHEEIRRPAVVGIVRDQLLLSPSPSWELRALAERCGISV
ncbi:helix-turn-helix transcriptional regulator [Streptomyces sp. NPDC049881]|uniref:helix-turn-helix domain-containing protein n=1 Tax=Streptomyces sp. NPDC049881 TaxID=3155778 RepID=UPI00342E0C95